MSSSVTFNAQPILIVDDDDDIREVTALLLSDLHYQVATARNGRDALELLRGSGPKPRLVLVDLMMPVMDGFAFVREVSSDPALNKIPLVVISAHGNLTEAQKTELNVPVFYKPMQVPLLLELVKRHC